MRRFSRLIQAHMYSDPTLGNVLGGPKSFTQVTPQFSATNKLRGQRWEMWLSLLLESRGQVWKVIMQRWQPLALMAGFSSLR